jgi:hypothetical protein
MLNLSVLVLLKMETYPEIRRTGIVVDIFLTINGKVLVPRQEKRAA